MEETIRIQWFPGHMAKTRRLMAENLKLVDIVAELLDARIPLSSRNPEIDKLLQNKPRIVLLNKSDCADEKITKDWIAYFAAQGIAAIPTDCKTGRGLEKLAPTARTVLKEKLERRLEKGMTTKIIRIMIVGVPNVGKSSLINKLAGSKRAKVEDRPGVTRGKQWVNLESGLELLDMPGVLWPKFEDPQVGENLAFTGAIKDDILDIEGLGMRFLEKITKTYPKYFESRFKIEKSEYENCTGAEILKLVAHKRGMLLPGGAYNTERAAIVVLDEFRAGKIGRISLESPQK